MGSYAVTAVALDDNGFTNVSSAVSFTVNPISVVITNPVNNTFFTASPTNIVLDSTVGDIAGTVTQLQYFQGGAYIGTASNAPYAFTWTNVSNGFYTFNAVAFDDNGYAATSSVVKILVTPLLATNTALLWLKADAITALSSNAPISTWPDSSGRSNNATQSTGTAQPAWIPGAINGLPVVRFNGSNGFVNLPGFLTGMPQAEVFMVLKVASTNATHGLWNFGGSGSAYNEVYTGAGGYIQEDFGSTSYYNLGTPAQPTMQYHVYQVSAQTNNWAAWMNGSLLYQTVNNSVKFDNEGSPTIGKNAYYFWGDIAEVMIFNRALTTGERATINAYLNSKYALVAAVPPTPTNLTAYAISPTQIGLSWSETLTNGGATQISIERSTASNGVFSVVAQVANALSYVDTNLTAGTTYYYQVRAMNLNTWSPYSNETNATTLAVGASAPFGSLSLWLKADAGLVQGSTNTPVDLWADQSGNGNNASQTAVANQPSWIPGAINGLPVVRFNGSNSFVNLPGFLTGMPQAEVFVVLKVAETNATGHGVWWQWH